MLDRYLRKNFGKFVELGEFSSDGEVEIALKRHRLKRRALHLAVSVAILLPVFLMGYLRYGGGKGREEPMSVREYYLLGIKAYEQGDYENAVGYLEQVVRQGPPEDNELNTYLKIADSFYNVTWPDREETYRKALRYYEKALGSGTPEQVAPHVPWIYYQMGNCQRNVRAFERSFDSGQEDKENRGAIDYYDEVITKYPSSAYAPHALYYKAACYRAGEQFTKAREIYYEVCENYPKHELAKESVFDIADSFVEEAKLIGQHAQAGTMDLGTVETE